MYFQLISHNYIIQNYLEGGGWVDRTFSKCLSIKSNKNKNIIKINNSKINKLFTVKFVTKWFFQLTHIQNLHTFSFF